LLITTGCPAERYGRSSYVTPLTNWREAELEVHGTTETEKSTVKAVRELLQT